MVITIIVPLSVGGYIKLDCDKNEVIANMDKYQKDIERWRLSVSNYVFHDNITWEIWCFHWSDIIAMKA